MKCGAVILARMGSSRLPGKPLMAVPGSDSLLALIIRRLSASHHLAGRVIVATTDLPIDDTLVSYCKTIGIDVYRGDENDVAGRIAALLGKSDWDGFLRINGDSPFVQPDLVDKAIEMLSSGDYQIITNLHPRSFPYGIAVELIDRNLFLTAYTQMDNSADKEHVTSYFYRDISRYRHANITCPLGDYSHTRLTIDTHDDFERMSLLMQSLISRGILPTTASLAEILGQ